MNSKRVSLKSIEISGFKSFARRTKIDFGDGLIAIVGPNGSGKSNIADAIKWVFGEQKIRSLRTDKSEDLIYHGGDGRSRSSMAEVIITLDNSSGKIPIDFSEIEIGRRLYRDGESNYLLNGKKVSLTRLQELLSSAGFGVGSYTVIGQGTVEKLILSSGTERKRLFEEASGIKQFEIKLDQTQKRLLATQQNLVQIDNLINEIKPQLESAERQASLLAKKDDLLNKIASYKLTYILTSKNNIESQIEKLTITENELKANIDSLKYLLNRLENDKPATNSSSKVDAQNIDKNLQLLEAQRQKLEEEISQHKLKLQNIISNDNNKSELDRIKQEIYQCNKSLKEHSRLQDSLQKKITSIAEKISVVDKKIETQTSELDKTKKLLKNSQKTEYLRHCLGLLDILQENIRSKRPINDINIVFYKLRRMLRHSINDNSAELALKVGRVQNNISSLLDEKETLSDNQTNEIIKLRALELDTASLLNKLKELEKNQNSLITINKDKNISIIQELKTVIIEKEHEAKTVAKEVGIQRHQLVELAAQNENEDYNDYYEQHEKLSGELIVATQKKESNQNDKNELLTNLNSINSLYKQWFKNGHRGIKTLEVAIELSDIDSLNAQLMVLEEINPGIETNRHEVSERMQFLQNQKKDLQASVEDLSKLADNIEHKIKAVFEKGFQKINSNFNNTFKNLFDGGMAELRLISSEEGYGIDIIVQLPNKKQQNLSSLSGGEKALASMALLSAILLSNPSPFIVLDEVDAALDESNTKKFSESIASITKHSQVLVITHNHETMSVADELIGVTTSGKNDSHILKARLDNMPI